MNIIKNSYLCYLILALAGMMSIFAFAPFNYSFMVIVSLFLLLLVIENRLNQGSSNLKVLLYGYIYGLAYFNTQIYWIFYSLYKVINTGFVVAIIAMVGFTLFLATYISLGILTYIKLKTRNKVFNYLFLFPSTWALFEWLRGWILGGFPWCEIGYSQVDTTFLKGFYPILGNIGVSWLTISLAGVVFLIFSSKKKLVGEPEVGNELLKARAGKHNVRVAIIYTLLLITIGTLIRDIQYTKLYGKPVKVALLQGNISQGVKWSTEESLKRYARLVKKANADIIIVPETAVSQFEHNLPKGYIDWLIKTAKEKNAELIVGIPKLLDDTNYVNAAMLLTDPKRPYYAKAHLVPYGEYIPWKWLLGPVYSTFSLPMVGFTPGAEYQEPFVAANQKLAFNICYENGFSIELLKAASNSTIMVNLSDMVWYGRSIAKDQHLQLSQVRALENQRYFIQATNTSNTAIIRPDGTIQSSLPIFEEYILTDYVQGRIGLTPFEKFGNFSIISFILLMIVISRLLARNKLR